MTVDHIIEKFIAYPHNDVTEIKRYGVVVIGSNKLNNLGCELWRGGAQEIKASLIEHIQSLPLEKEFSEKLVAQVNSIQDRYSRY